jgi:hypothetical protein
LPERAGAFLRWCANQQPNTPPSLVIALALKDRSWPVQSSKLSVLLQACSNLGERLDVKRAHSLWRRERRLAETELLVTLPGQTEPQQMSYTGLCDALESIISEHGTDLRDVNWDVQGGFSVGDLK